MNELKPCPLCNADKPLRAATPEIGIPSGDNGYRMTIKCRECGCAITRWALKKAWAISSAETAWYPRAQPDITGETSDGYHTFNELYHHRAVLFSVICNSRPDIAWRAKRHHDGTMYDGMFIVGINTPDGQATYHYDVEPYWDMFRVRELPQAPEWDGHTAAQAIERIGRLSAQPDNASLTLHLGDGKYFIADYSYTDSDLVGICAYPRESDDGVIGAADVGSEGKTTESVGAVLRIEFSKREAIDVVIRALERAKGYRPDVPIALEELRWMDGEPVWMVFDDNSAMWALVHAGNAANQLKLTGNWGEQIVLAEHEDHIKAIYRRKPEPEGGEG